MSILGLGWIHGEKYGQGDTGEGVAYESLRELRSEEAGFFTYPVKNFGRFNDDAKFACCAVALALHDANIVYSAESQASIGMIGTSKLGALHANQAYYQDFVDCGKTLARGNLFIYTLPTSPLAEVMIHFGLQGPLLYAVGGTNEVGGTLDLCATMMETGQASRMGWLRFSEQGASCCLMDGVDEATRSVIESLVV